MMGYTDNETETRRAYTAFASPHSSYNYGVYVALQPVLLMTALRRETEAWGISTGEIMCNVISQDEHAG